MLDAKKGLTPLFSKNMSYPLNSPLPCQICGNDNWTVLAERIFSAGDADARDQNSQYVFKFIFEVWFPGETKLCVKNLCCNHCGFICFYPRPSEQDLNVLRLRDAVTQVGFCPMTDIATSQRRSRCLCEYIQKKIKIDKIKTVLDYGGMDGNLMQAFIAKGKACFLVDYCPYCIPNMTKLGNTVYELKESNTFDLIVCSHVIEHVAAPVRVLSRLARHLSKDGILFVEVPMELWKRPPLLNQQNPITHVNFFSPNSLANLFFAAGLTVEKCHFVEYLHTSADWNPGIRCLGHNAGSVDTEKFLPPDARKYLEPTAMSYLHFYFGNPRRLKRELLKLVKL